MAKKAASPLNEVSLDFTDSERRVLLEYVWPQCDGKDEFFEDVSSGQSVRMPLGDVPGFALFIDALSQRSGAKERKALAAISDKTCGALLEVVQANPEAMPVEEVREAIALAMRYSDAEPSQESPSGPALAIRPETEPGPLALAQDERDALARIPSMGKRLIRKLTEGSRGARLVKLTKKELVSLHSKAQFGAQLARTEAAQDLMDGVIQRIEELLENSKSRLLDTTPAQPTDQLFQFRVTLLGTDPEVWRRIQVRDCTLGELHEHIQAAMGWENYHLHRFRIEGLDFMPMSEEHGPYDFECEDEDCVILSEIIPPKKKAYRFLYEYDFGDGWEHLIEFEGNPSPAPKAKYPLCVDGARACPPEDVGGIWGFADFLEAQTDRRHERHEEFMEWYGRFDAKKFNPKQATRAMRRGTSER